MSFINQSFNFHGENILKYNSESAMNILNISHAGLSFLDWDHCVAAQNQHQASDYLHHKINQNEHIKSNVVSFSSEETMKVI